MIQVTPDKVVTIGTVFLLLGLPCSSGEFKQHTHGENKGTTKKTICLFIKFNAMLVRISVLPEVSQMRYRYRVVPYWL